MSENSKNTVPNWVDPDEIPDMTTPYWEAKFNEAPVSRGRPILPVKKVSTTIRLDSEILEKFRAQGPRWQSRINEALKEWLARG
jgi:uncharacterized protein (DUF4415 family)